MCRNYIESIRVEDGVVYNLDLHQLRVCRGSNIILEDIISSIKLPKNGIFKLRVVYNGDSVIDCSLSEYSPKVINTLQIICDNDIDYSYKYEDRSNLNSLFVKKRDADDILILKNGLFTDSSFCNILFSNGEGWFTPSTPLLNGVCRQSLLLKGVVKECDISIMDLNNYRYFMLINAMLDFNLNRALPISNIFG